MVDLGRSKDVKELEDMPFQISIESFLFSISCLVRLSKQRVMERIVNNHCILEGSTKSHPFSILGSA